MNDEKFSIFTWELIKYLAYNYDTIITASDEIYKQRVEICKSCDKFDDIEKVCMACGCPIGPKTRAITESCPLGKWQPYKEDWETRSQPIKELKIQILDKQEDNE